MSLASRLATTAFLVASMTSVQGFAAEPECDHCGCHRVKKVTRLVKVCRTIRVPLYECKPDSAFFPKKGTVAHCDQRCEDNPTLCSSTCICERCVERHEPCEHITHVVKKSECPCDQKCSESEHHDNHYDYHVSFTNNLKLTKCPTIECQTNIGVTPCGCTKQKCLSKPTGEFCEKVVTEVKWVTFQVCEGCDHNWADHH